VPVSRMVIASRLTVVYGFGYILGALFLLLAFAALSLVWLTSLKKRPLQLGHDPNTAIAAALMLEGTETTTSFRDLNREPLHQIEMAVKDTVFIMNAGRMHRMGNDSLSAINRSSAPTIQLSKSQIIFRNVGLIKANCADNPEKLNLFYILTNRDLKFT
jgi:hypothetical protein